MKIQCAIFDFDGTLFDSMQMWNTAADEYLRSIGREPAPGLRDAVKAMSLRRAAEYLQKKSALTQTVEEILAGIDGIVERFYMQEAQPKPGVPEFLREMQRAGIAMCIATATSRYLIEAALKRCGLERFFDAIFTCGEVGHGKDEPAIYRAAMDYFRAERGNTVVFEDAIHAVTTAKRDGFRIVAVYDESEKRQAEIQAMGDCYLSDFEHPEPFWRFAAALEAAGESGTEGRCGK